MGGYLKIPCGFDSVIGIIEGDYQQESHAASEKYGSRVAAGQGIDRYVNVSVFGAMSGGRFERGISSLPLVKSKAYLLAPEDLITINSPTLTNEATFRVGALAGYSGTSVCLPLNKLLPSHIGVFGNTGSGKSNTLCKLYGDCFEMIDRGIGLNRLKSRFVFIDFNGEYVKEDTLTNSKCVYDLNTRTTQDRIPVPEDFYTDADTWSILTQATEKTQRPFLNRCIRMESNVAKAKDPEKYLRALLTKLLGGYSDHAIAFGEQREELAKLISLALSPRKRVDPLDAAARSLEKIEVFSQGVPKVHKQGSKDYLDSATKVSTVFSECLSLTYDFEGLAQNKVRLLMFIAYYQYLEQWREGRIVREHIAPWISRYVEELRRSEKLYEVAKENMIASFNKPVVVFSLLKVSQEQKRVIPLVVAKYLYGEQKLRGQDSLDTSVHLIIDEAHNILSHSSQRESESWRDYRLETFEEIVKEGRKFGMYLTVCSQRPADISPTILSQIHNYFIHRLVNDEDLKAIAKSVSFIDNASMSMIPVLPQGCCIVSGTASAHPTRIQVEQLGIEKQPKSYDRDLAAHWNMSNSHLHGQYARTADGNELFV